MKNAKLWYIYTHVLRSSSHLSIYYTHNTHHTLIHTQSICQNYEVAESLSVHITITIETQKYAQFDF
jgi:hypothetical protein